MEQSWKPWYRCRLCGMKFAHPDPAVILVGIDLAVDGERADDFPIVFHDCSPKGRGIGEFVGIMHAGASPDA